MSIGLMALLDDVAAIAKLAAQSRSYYGMHVAHLGIAFFIIGVALVGGYETEKDVRMEIGDTVEVGGYTFRFNGAKKAPGPNYMSDIGNVDVLRDGKKINVLEPEKRTYNASGMPMTEAATSMSRTAMNARPVSLRIRFFAASAMNATMPSVSRYFCAGETNS